MDNLIGFYYGRNPGRYQQDTVLQHSRMYGNRSREDLSVTRFYTTTIVHAILRRINENDEVLRNALESGGSDHGVVFIQKDLSGKITPCSPNKILLSSTTTLKPGKRLLPVGFQTNPAYKIKSHVSKIDSILAPFLNSEEPVLMSVSDAINLLKETFTCFDTEKSNEGSSEAEIQSALVYLASKSTDVNNAGKIYVLARDGRNASRLRESEKRFENSPDTEKREGNLAKRFGTDTPVLIMLRQNGNHESGWRAGPFWWPVLMAQQNILPAIYASETQEWSDIDLI